MSDDTTTQTTNGTLQGPTPPALALAEETARRRAKKASAPTKKAPVKTAPKKVAKAKGEAKPVLSDGLDPKAVIKWIGPNPAREGSARFERIAKLMKFDGKTVDAFQKAKGRMDTLRNSVRLKLAKVT